MAGLDRLGSTLSRNRYDGTMTDLERVIAEVLGRGAVRGLALSAGSGLVVNISAGIMVGIKAVAISATSASMPASSTSYVWIDEAGIVTTSSTTTDVGSDHVCLGKVVTTGSAITSVTTEGRTGIAHADGLRKFRIDTDYIGFFGSTPVLKSAVSDPSALVVTNGSIGGLSIGASYSQAEVQALRDKCEDLRDDVAALQTKLAAAIDALQAVGLL